jgi:hypothetical protein
MHQETSVVLKFFLASLFPDIACVSSTLTLQSPLDCKHCLLSFHISCLVLHFYLYGLDIGTVRFHRVKDEKVLHALTRLQVDKHFVSIMRTLLPYKFSLPNIKNVVT